MKYVVLTTETDPGAWDRATDDEREAVFAAHTAFDRGVRERGTLLGGAALAGAEAATTLRTTAAGRVVTEGPYAETAEQLTGFYEIDVPDLDVAIGLCRLLPEGYTVEIRPVIEIEGYDPS